MDPRADDAADTTAVRATRDLLVRGVGRRRFLQAATALGGGAALPLAGAATAAASSGPSPSRGRSGGRVAVPDAPLQPGTGRIDGDHYLPSDVDAARWGYLPSTGADPVLTMVSGQTVTIDAVSHEGILEDQGRDPVRWFAQYGVGPSGVLDDAVPIAAGYDCTPRSFDVDGPHVVTGPVFVEGAEPGDVLKVETTSALLRVPYGVVSSRHGARCRAWPAAPCRRGSPWTR